MYKCFVWWLILLLGGMFGVVSRNSFTKDLFFGIDYHSHLGTEIGGLAYLDGDIKIIIHNINNSQFKSNFQKDFKEIEGTIGIGIISDSEDEQPIKFESKIGKYVLCTVGFIRNIDKLYNELLETGATLKKSRIDDGRTIPNPTEIVGEIIGREENLVDGITRVYERIEGTVSLLLLSKNEESIYASGGVFPLILGNRGSDWAIASETSSFPNLGYENVKYLDYREIVSIGCEGVKKREDSPKKKRFCPFLHVYFGFPASDYYGVNAEIVRERCGGFLAEDDDVQADLVLGIADSGFPHSIGYVKRKIEMAKLKVDNCLQLFKKGEIDHDSFEIKIRRILESTPSIRRPLIKYTPGWGRSYIPPTQETRETIARYKQVPNPQVIRGKKIILVDDSIRRGTQLQNLLREKIWPYEPMEIHGRISSPPQMYPCIYDLSTKKEDLATYKAFKRINKNIVVDVKNEDADYDNMVEEIRNMIGFTTLRFQKLKNLVKAIIKAPNNKGLRKEDLCLYCWTGK